MFDQVVAIVESILTSFVDIWPYLLVTIPLAVAVQMSGASKYISRAFQARPIIAVLLATAVGAFSPFCSCGVVPVVATLLISGVPLAPVMSFWIASPSMDPEAFFLSVAMIGWDLAVWRLAATLILSLGAGLATHWVVKRGWLGEQILRSKRVSSPQSTWELVKAGWRQIEQKLTTAGAPGFVAGNRATAPAMVCCGTAGTGTMDRVLPAPNASCGSPEPGTACSVTETCGCGTGREMFVRRLLRETWSATLLVVKFMALAFFLTALIKLYVPEEWVAGLLGGQTLGSVVLAALLGVPVYTSNLTALPLVSGLLAQGMSTSAALAFLVAGPTTTLPAMAAVWGLASRRVFLLYVSFSLLGAIILGSLHGLVTAFLQGRIF